MSESQKKGEKGPFWEETHHFFEKNSKKVYLGVDILKSDCYNTCNVYVTFL